MEDFWCPASMVMPIWFKLIKPWDLHVGKWAIQKTVHLLRFNILKFLYFSESSIVLLLNCLYVFFFFSFDHQFHPESVATCHGRQIFENFKKMTVDYWLRSSNVHQRKVHRSGKLNFLVNINCISLTNVGFNVCSFCIFSFFLFFQNISTTCTYWVSSEEITGYVFLGLGAHVCHGLIIQ